MTVNSLSEEVGPPLPDTPFESCWQLFLRAARKNPEGTAFISIQQPHDWLGSKSKEIDQPEYKEKPYLRWNFAQYEAMVIKVAFLLLSHGANKDVPVITFMPNTIEQMLIFWACQLLGASWSPLNSRNLSAFDEVDDMLNTILQHRKGKKALIIAGDCQTAQQIDHHSLLDGLNRIVLGEAEGWLSFGSLLAAVPEGITARHIPNPDNDCVIAFTSGTTSRPKARVWTQGSAVALINTFNAGGEAYVRGINPTIAVASPNNHILWLITVMMFQFQGGAVLYPGPFFEPGEFLNAARVECCTHILGVPTLIQALLLAKDPYDTPLKTLKCITMGGDIVSPELLRRCIADLGSKKVEIICGSTEGGVMLTGERDPEELIDGKVSACGWCMAGQRIKLIDPNTGEIVPRGTPGELHIASSDLPTNYIDSKSDNFYQDAENIHWYKAGDQAILQPDGRLYYVGRYKDMIIRGGENLAPAAIETTLKREMPMLEKLRLIVVGATDPYSGEVPVAVVTENLEETTIQAIKRTVIAHLGQLYAVDEVLSLSDLGIAQYPVTMGGKVQKAKVKELVAQYRRVTEVHHGGPTNLPIAGHLKAMLARMTGADVRDISNNSLLTSFVDSISLVRLRNRINKELSIDLRPRDLVLTDTVGRLIDAAKDASADGKQSPQVSKWPRRTGPPSLDDVVFTQNPAIFEETKNLAIGAVARVGLTWADVRDITPAYDYTRMIARDGTACRWSFKYACASKGYSKQDLKRALARALANNPMIASFMVWDDETLGPDLALQFTVEHDAHFTDQLMVDCGTVATEEELCAEALRRGEDAVPSFPGPFFKAYLYHIESSSSAGFILDQHHAVADDSFYHLFIQDLDASLTNSSPLTPHIPYKVWCDSYHASRCSAAADVALHYQVKKAERLEHLQDKIWPPISRTGTLTDPVFNTYDHSFAAKGVQELCARHPELSPSIVAKVAHSIFQIRASGHSVAIFGHMESARGKFPFLPTSSDVLSNLDASDVGGQIYHVALNIVELGSDTTTRSLFAELLEDQKLQTEFACAPCGRILDALSSEAAKALPIAMNETYFNWLGTEHENDQSLTAIKPVVLVGRHEQAAFSNEIRLVVRTDGEDKIMMGLRSRSFGLAELKMLASEMEYVTSWLTDEANWNKPIKALLLDKTSI